MPRPTEISTYNPHLLARDDLVASFVARRALLDELVDDLRRGSHQHHLIIGARGAGKTTLLLRLAVAIEEDKKLARTALPLRFPEEQYNVAYASDFWLNCLDALSDVLEARGDHAAKRKLEAAVAAIAPLAESERSVQAIAALVAWARTARRSLVLLVDNFDLILERLRDAQWALREALSHDNGLVLIGATSKFLEDAIADESPLHDFFRVHELGQVTEEEARSVVLHLAKLRGDQQVQAVLESDAGRFKALYILTGGMPRMLVLLSSVLARDSSSAEADLERMLDQLTPSYKARFDELPPQSQRVVDAVALHWHPITAAACAEQTRFDVKVVSAQLHRLVQQGILTKSALPGSARLGFLITERFFNIWYLMRANRRVRQKLAWFVEFLRMWYGEEELAHRAQALLDANPGADDPVRMLALATAVPDVALRRRLESRAVGMLLERSHLDEIRELLDLGGVNAQHLTPMLDRAKTLKQIRARVASKPKLARAAEAIIGSPIASLALQSRCIDALLREGESDPTFRNLKELHDTYHEWLGAPLFAATRRGELPSLADVATRDEVAALLELATDRQRVATLIIMDSQIHNNPAAHEVFRHVIELEPEYVPLVFYVITFLAQQDDWHWAQRLLRETLQRSAPAWNDTEYLSHVLSFSRQWVQRGKALDIASLLAELGLDDRWLPLHEALKVAGTSDPDLSHLAPEARAPTAVVLAFLRREEGTTAAEVSPSARWSRPREHRSGRVSGDRGATRRRTSRRRGRAARAAPRRARARRRRGRHRAWRPGARGGGRRRAGPRGARTAARRGARATGRAAARSRSPCAGCSSAGTGRSAS